MGKRDTVMPVNVFKNLSKTLIYAKTMHTLKYVFLFYHSVFRFICLIKSVSLLDYNMMKKHEAQEVQGWPVLTQQKEIVIFGLNDCTKT